MKTKEIRYPAANGAYDIKALIIAPDGAPRAIIQIAHGMNEYAERYDEFAKFLVDEGFVVCVNDHAGHGDSYAELRGFFGDKNGALNMVKDMRRLTELVKSEFPNLPVFLFGHSMGSFLARYYCSLYGGDLSGAIFSGTGNAPGILVIAECIARLQKLIFGARHSGAFLRKISGGAYNRRFRPGRTGSEWLTRDEKKIDEFLSNPKSQFTFTVGGYLDLFGMMRYISSPKWAGMMPKTIPVYIYSGSDDPVGNYGKGLNRVFESLRAAGLKDVTIKVYDKGRHEMHNELNRDEVYRDVKEWVKARLAGSGGCE